MSNETSPPPSNPSKPVAQDMPTDTGPEIAEPESKKPIFLVLAIVLVLLSGIVTWTVASDHYAPGSSRGIVSASVVQVAPRVSGRIIAIEVHDNAILDTGDAMFRIDPRPFELAVERAQASLAQVVQGVDASSAQIEAAQAQIAQARANADTARTSAERSAALFERGIVSGAARDQAQANLAAAEAALHAAQATAESARLQLGAAGEGNPQIRAAELALEVAEYDLLSTVARAPGPGVVTNVHLGLGQFVGTGSPTMTFIDGEAVWITADLRENQLVNVQPNDRVTLVFDAIPGQIFEGHVESLGWGINPGRSEVGGLPVNTPISQWFEPARKMPVRIVLEGTTHTWPRQARLGGKVNVLIHPDGGTHFVTRTAAFFQRIGSWTTALY
ncbi:HlyD family secretion protein [Pontivivens nitratireducens]|uniref:HlyD family secretion protein n=1 Tax=Pontivivens nitratireducens TaxID=2758038 RepID=UPI00201BEF91|nr:HlyD family secretion protein [Pontibrevibacter nitratireducens]